VRDYDRLLLAMRGHDIVVHAAAYKQVPSAEANVDEAIATNVLGSLNVARAAVHNNVEHVVGVSTDKACMPVNAYGETKALMEKLFQQADAWSDTMFSVVRYGNVLGSRGSVVPLFREQLRAGKVTLTDPAMTRFWLTLHDAVDLVVSAYATDSDEAHDGAILVPEASASDMQTLLDAVALAEGYAQDTYKVTLIGTRAGEKQHEQLVHINESRHTMPPCRDLAYFQILPATTGYRGDPFEYRSDTAPRLAVEVLAEMVASDDG
jgi:UDP-N-acetylglucosamine 4,6-dehydratase